MSVLSAVQGLYSRFRGPREAKLPLDEIIEAKRCLDEAIQAGLPKVLHRPLRFLATRELDPKTAKVAKRAEARRQNIANSKSPPIEVIYSPKPGSATDADRPQPGNSLLFSMKKVAQIGKNQKWGAFLHLCATSSRARQIIELGSCAGLSAYYLGSAPNCEKIVTIEGAKSLAEIARDTLAPLGNRAQVVNALFDDALDTLLPPKEPFDLAYIDGHHEKVATIHYFKRLRPHLAPGALVLFDDISWSQDMRDGWDQLCSTVGFSDCVDLGAVGVCLWNGTTAKPKQWELAAVIGGSTVGQPKGWDLKAGALVE